MARILLIDDDDDLRTMLRRVLTLSGHTVVEARNGEEGLALFPQAAADLVITDIVMPGKEGLEVLMALRKKHPPVKIIAISGGGRGDATDYLHLAKQMGAARVLSKPFSNDALMSAIAAVLGSAAAPIIPPPS